MIVPGTMLERPVPQGSQALAILTLHDAFLNFFSRHEGSRYSFTYWPFQKNSGILQMGVGPYRTNYTGMLPAFGDYFHLSVVASDGSVIRESESILQEQAVSPFSISADIGQVQRHGLLISWPWMICRGSCFVCVFPAGQASFLQRTLRQGKGTLGY